MGTVQKVVLLGVRLPHKTIQNRLQWQFRVFPYATTEKTGVFKTALTFVDSVSEIWGPLLNGLAILVVQKDTTKDPEKLVALLEHYKVSGTHLCCKTTTRTTINCIYSLFQVIKQLQNTMNNDSPPRVQFSSEPKITVLVFCNAGNSCVIRRHLADIKIRDVGLY